MNINSYYPSAGGSFSHQPLSLHDGHQLSNGFHHNVSAAGFMSPSHYSGRALCTGYDIPSSQTKARFDADDQQMMRSGTADVNASSTREHQAGYATPHHPSVHHLHHHHQQHQQVSRWNMGDGGPGPRQTSTTPPPTLMQSTAFNPAAAAVTAGHHLNRLTSTDNSPPAAVSCQSPHSAGSGFNSGGHIPFYPWMGVVV